MRALRRPHRIAAVLMMAMFIVALPSGALADEVARAPVPWVPAISSPVPLALVGGSLLVTGHVDATATVVRITAPGQTVTVTVTPGPSGATFSASVPLRYGKSLIGVAAGNSLGYSATRHRIVYNLGAAPEGSHFVLVDKSDLQLYRVSGRRVVKVYPVAIGTPGTPTPVGSWHLGSPQRGGGPWGALRMPLLRKVKVKVRITVNVRGHHVHKWVWRTVSRGNGYYIHGTNAPWSIGTMASHGCVRMFNSNVRALSKVVRGWPVTIRR